MCAWIAPPFRADFGGSGRAGRYRLFAGKRGDSVTATKENARPVVGATGTGRESDNISNVSLFASLPHSHSTTQYGTRQDVTARNSTSGDIFQRAKAVSILDTVRRLGLGEPDRNGKILCPFHNDHHPSLHIDAAKNRWRCFVCDDKRGDAIDLVAEYRQIGKREAAQWLLGEESPKPKAPSDSGKIDEYVYNYPDGNRAQKRIRRFSDGTPKQVLGWQHWQDGQWESGRGSLPPILYECGNHSEDVFIVEGEKDAENFAALYDGFVYVVSGADGAGAGWKETYTERLRGVGVKTAVIISDNDESGRKYANETAAALATFMESVTLLDLRKVWPDMPEKGDVSDLISEFGATLARSMIDTLYNDTPAWTPPEPIEEKLPAPFPATVVPDDGERGRGRPPKIPLSPQGLKDELDRIGIKVRWNLITHCLDYEGIPETWCLDPEKLHESFRVMLEYELKPYYSGTRDIKRLLNLIGGQSRYNPVLDYIKAEPWDGHDYFSDFCDLLRISHDWLSCSLVRNFGLQGIAMLNNDPKRNWKTEGVLTLQGEQGSGKTTVADVLGMKPEWTLTGGRLDANDKDTHIRMTSVFIAEFGEVDGTFKRTDAARMKNFITQQTDRFRRPYGEDDTIQIRRTSFIATVNEPRFLVDRTGNRRYWTIHIEEKIPYSELAAFNALGFWRQAFAIWSEADADGRGGSCFRLTDKQRTALDERNKAHLVPTQAEEEVADIFAEAETEPGNFEWRKITISEFRLLYSSLSRYSVNALSRALKALGYEAKEDRRDGKGRAGKVERLLSLPCLKYSSSF